MINVGPIAAQSWSTERISVFIQPNPAGASGMLIIGVVCVLPVSVKTVIFLAVLISAVGGCRG